MDFEHERLSNKFPLLTWKLFMSFYKIILIFLQPEFRLEIDHGLFLKGCSRGVIF